MSAARRRAARRRSDRASRRAARAALVGLAGALLFLLGLAVGQATRENPRPGGTQTLVRTLDPLPLAPQASTVTVTTSSP